MHLLDHFTLLKVQVIRLQAELHKPVAVQTPHQIKVEIKLTPSNLPKTSTPLPEYQLGCRMFCSGHGNETENDPMFTAEVLMNAIYRQIHGPPITFEQFSTFHGQFNRQLYPLLRQHIVAQLLNLKITSEQLPQDLFTQMEGGNTRSDSGESSGTVH